MGRMMRARRKGLGGAEEFLKLAVNGGRVLEWSKLMMISGS